MEIILVIKHLKNNFLNGKKEKELKDVLDVKSIQKMLYRLVFKHRGSTEEEGMVDSIEEEFMKRKYGDNYYNANVTIEKAQIEKFNDISNNDNVYMGGQDDGEEE